MFSKSYASLVTVQPAPGAAVALGGLTLGDVANVQVTGVGGSGATMSHSGDFISGCGHNLSFDHITYTGGVITEPSSACSINLNWTWDHDRFDNLGAETWEGRFNVQALNTGPAQPNGITISNSHFRGSGAGSNCSDGIDVLGDGYGTTIGPGNEFTGMAQASCGAHVDPIQFYGGTASTITGNWFHDNGDGSGGIMSPDGDDGYTVTNNVFQNTGSYPYAITMGGCANCTITHNNFINATLEIGTTNGGGPASTNITARDNVFNTGIVILGTGNTYTATYNLNPGSPAPATPTEPPSTPPAPQPATTTTNSPPPHPATTPQATAKAGGSAPDRAYTRLAGSSRLAQILVRLHAEPRTRAFQTFRCTSM